MVYDSLYIFRHFFIVCLGVLLIKVLLSIQHMISVLEVGCGLFYLLFEQQKGHDTKP